MTTFHSPFFADRLRRLVVGLVYCFFAAFSSGFLTAGCSGNDAGDDGARCVPGKSETCPCKGGGQGIQVCGGTGIFGPCDCGLADGSIGDATGSDDGLVADGTSGAGGDDGGSSGRSSGGSDVTGVSGGDGFVVLTDVGADAIATQACEPCGYSQLKGKVCSPSEQIFVSGAKVSLTVIDCDGKKKTFQTTTGKDGTYHFPKVPCGKHKAVVTSGSFSTSFNIHLKPGGARDISGIGDKLCFKANAAKIAVFWDQWDKQHDLIKKLGFNYDWYNFKQEYFADKPYKDIDAVKLLRNYKELSKYDILMFNCGSAAQKFVDQFHDIPANLKKFVENGGSIYASDLSWAYVEAAFPDAIDFYGKIDLPTGPSNDGPQVVEPKQWAPATLKDPALANYVGQTTFKAHYGSGPLIAMEKAGAYTTVHATVVVQIENKGAGPFDPKTKPHAGPAIVSHKPNKPGAGKVMYTTFHNDEQADTIMLKILHYLVFLL